MKAAVAIGGVDGLDLDVGSRDVIFFTVVASRCDFSHRCQKLPRNFSSDTGFVHTYSGLDVIR